MEGLPAQHRLAVFVDAHAPVLRVQTSRTGGTQFSVKAGVEIYRTTTQKTALGRGMCNTYNDIPDVLLDESVLDDKSRSSENSESGPPDGPSDGGPDSVRWYHRNDYAIANGNQTSYYDWSMQQAGL